MANDPTNTITDIQHYVMPPNNGTPESAAWLREALTDLEQSPGSMARLMKRKGDDRQLASIERQIQRMLAGQSRLPGEMRVILTMMRRAKHRGVHRTAEKATARPSEPTELTQPSELL